MTAAKIYHSKPDDESSLLKNQKYYKKILYLIDSVIIFKNYPLLNNWLINSLYFIFIVISIFLLTPSALIVFSILVLLFLTSIVVIRGLFTSMFSNFNLYVINSCSIDEVDNYDHDLKVTSFINIQSEDERIMWIWCIIIAYTVPELINSILCFKKSKKQPSVKQFLSVFIPETFYTLGIALMIFFVLPNLNLNSKAFVLFFVWCIFEWGLYTIISTIYENNNLPFKIIFVMMDTIALAMYIIYAMFYLFNEVDRNNNRFWITILALALIHCGFWQDIPYSKFSFTGFLQPFVKAREKLEPVKHYTFAFVSIWKIIVFIISSLIILSFNSIDVTNMYTMFGSAFSTHNVTVIPNINQTTELPYTSTISITTLKNMSLPTFIVFFQIFVSTTIYVKRNTLFLSIFHGFDFRTRWGLNIPFLFTIIFFLSSALSNKYYCNVINNSNLELAYYINPLIAKLLSEILRIFSFYSTEEWDSNFLKHAIYWIILHFFLRSRFSLLLGNKKQTNQENKISQPVNVCLVSMNEKSLNNKIQSC